MSLTVFLQEEFKRLCPADWHCQSEVALLHADWQRLLGYAPRADLLLERKDKSKRLWLEFEISRADPVANHAKFATSHLFQPLCPQDVFVSAVSPHVTSGRRNLASNTISLMRHIGINAFQMVLFPHLTAHEIKKLNHLDQNIIAAAKLDVQPEIDRVFLITRPVENAPAGNIYYAGEIIEVMLNLYNWNQEIKTASGSRLWGKRTITYFVYDPGSKEFAPAKFCAYVGIPVNRSSLAHGMSIELYAGIDPTQRIFDGERARVHLAKHMGMVHTTENVIHSHFAHWLHQHKDAITVHPEGPTFLAPPEWFKAHHETGD